ncbi:GNAT family N-acetyltransferase [Actinomadura rayongensis]|uniref:GNAT family N-acetyltransferase n=1 Tax=Actinomadura rayongensis TaxID=1429076 RepID=A0A6I4WCY2_9ACTN|nr:GNAT family N-acetyltransferase [Actinomadura rayongensis]
MTDFERLIDAAWPAPVVADVHGWRLRFADGVTKRANSVWPAAHPADADAAIRAAEEYYLRRDERPTFHIGPGARPAALDALLERRGYVKVDPTLVLTADLDAEVPPPDAEIADAPSQEWMDAWWSVDGRYDDGEPVARRILTGTPARYAAAGDGAAVGRAVPQGDWLGVYCMAVRPEARRRGLARTVLRALLADGRARGARRAYLCVTERNAAARALYAAAGFTVAARYHYRVRPPGTG